MMVSLKAVEMEISLVDLLVFLKVVVMVAYLVESKVLE